ncbi:hypothetical protein [Mucilaginibacter aquariorum]|uniref:Uncharacterized protein n=1 Tax=Mucilaginibacter aquariorum TaxID=2967225 RepID=A0ABT1T9N1_9SPHI|nr:hypothetical protein [Mucilaginibacter aquariorum]MCQ6961085.1 hypothetical protein [Mucilaginibacter aquariorum]
MGQQFTVLDFNAMPMNGQADIAIAGNFLGGQKEGDFIVQLHRVDNFYVGVFYDPVKNEIVRYEGFTNTNRPTPYIRLN